MYMERHRRVSIRGPGLLKGARHPTAEPESGTRLFGFRHQDETFYSYTYLYTNTYTFTKKEGTILIWSANCLLLAL
jgi:hypothetical protein